MRVWFFRAKSEIGGEIDEAKPLPAEGFEILMPSAPSLAYEQVTYRKVFVKNVGDKPVKNVAVYIKEQTPSPDDDVFLASGTPDDTVEQAKNYQFLQPMDKTTAILLAEELLPGESASFWVKRIVRANPAPFPKNHYTIAVVYTFRP